MTGLPKTIAEEKAMKRASDKAWLLENDSDDDFDEVGREKGFEKTLTEKEARRQRRYEKIRWGIY